MPRLGPASPALVSDEGPFLSCRGAFPHLLLRFPHGKPGSGAEFLWDARSSFASLEEKVAKALGVDDAAGDDKQEAIEEDLVVPEGPLQPPHASYGKPPPIDGKGNYERAMVPADPEQRTLPDYAKMPRPRGHDRYDQVDGPIDPADINLAMKKQAEEEASNDANRLAKEGVETSDEASAVQTGEAADDDEARRLRAVEAAEAGKRQAFSYKPKQSPAPPAAPPPPTPVAAAVAAPPEPKKITLPEAQRGVFVPGEIEPWQTRMYNPQFHH